ncbi:MAG: class I SAM-dependent methyltransferase [Acidobacteriaceae bacterium]|jgi:SAM-dependent methyltransferase|nr:class I SAM-dependent methyltransferase [Acidobacteriaceae bacterium]
MSATLDRLPSADVRQQFGDIDIYLFDQLLRGRFDRRTRVLDAGCGRGRNLSYFFQHGYDVRAADVDAAAMRSVQQLAETCGVTLAPDALYCGSLDSLPWADHAVDAVICSAVLHFARDEADARAMLDEMWRILAPGGLFFARLATSIGLEDRLPAAVGRMTLPDGSDRFVVDEATLRGWTDALNGVWLDPIKTTNVNHQRAMTTWVIEKRA